MTVSLTHERERSLRREHARLHPKGKLPSGRECEVCVLLAALFECQDVLGRSLPALGLHARGFSQEALVRAAHIIGSRPEDWTNHPETMEGRRALVGRTFRGKLGSAASGTLASTPKERPESEEA